LIPVEVQEIKERQEVQGAQGVVRFAQTERFASQAKGSRPRAHFKTRNITEIGCILSGIL